MDLDGAVTLGVGHAREDESVGHLVVVEEVLLGLVNLSRDNLSSAGGARSGTARVGKFDFGFFGGVNNENVVGTLECGGMGQSCRSEEALAEDGVECCLMAKKVVTTIQTSCLRV